MTIFDYVVFAIVLVSIALGWWRGIVYELLSLLGWAAAFFVAKLFAPEIVQYVPDAIASDTAKTAIAYAVLFIVTLILSGLVAWSFSKLIKFVGLGWMDGAFGALFGLLRGVLLVLVLVLLAGLTSLPKEPAWKEAWSSHALQSVALFTKDFLPQDVAQKVTY
jgi:membrane protein required for colicin V production